MIQEYKNKTNIGVGLGLVINIIGSILSRQIENPAISILGSLLLIVGSVIFIWGCWKVGDSDQVNLVTITYFSP